MSRTAALWAGWDRRAPRSLAGPLAPSPGASRPGVPFLESTLGPDARIIIEIAWGADLTASSDSWSWTDVTTDVFYGDGTMVEVFVGAADEASTTQPATCIMQVNNEAGLYSLGIQSPNWPHVRRNTPVRVRVDPGTGAETVWFGFADGFTPTWGAGGRDARVTLKASGVLRRLLQRKSPVVSPFRRSTRDAVESDLVTHSDVMAYWPCEDGENATSIASGEPGGAPMAFYRGPPEFAASTAFACSRPLPRLAGSAWCGPVPTDGHVGELQVRALIAFPEAGSPDAAVVFRFHTTGSADLWEMRYFTGGILSVRAWGSGSVLFEQGVAFDCDGTKGQFGIQLIQNGPNVEWSIDALLVGATTSGGFGSALAGHTQGRCYKMEVNTDDAHQDLVIGHVTVYDGTTIESIQIASLNAHDHEPPIDRLRRLCLDYSVELEIVDVAGAETVHCGFQSIETLVGLLREAEAVDQGVLHDGLAHGLTFITRRSRENLEPFVQIDIANGDLSAHLQPVDDDQRNVNIFTASRKGGSEYTFEDRDGPAGTLAIHDYDGSGTFANDQDGELSHYGSWMVHKGTVVGYRYPRLDLDLTHSAALIKKWLTPLVGGRIDVLGIETMLAQHPAGTISLGLEGYRHSISQTRWLLSANCSLYQPWRIGVFAATSGDTNPLVLRYETDGASLALGVDPGAASLSVTVTGTRFTTLADDFPLQIDLDGLVVAVTNITGTTSPQTFTVDPATVTAPRPAGSPITVITPPLGL